MTKYRMMNNQILVDHSSNGQQFETPYFPVMILSLIMNMKTIKKSKPYFDLPYILKMAFNLIKMEFQNKILGCMATQCSNIQTASNFGSVNL